jgi:hypothetical protein
LERLLMDPALRARLGGQARAQHAVRFEISAYVDKLVDVWRGASHRTANCSDRASLSERTKTFATPGR